MSFSVLALSPQTLRSVRNRGHQHPTPIQSAAIPIALAGRDLVATAGTGSGKTAAFLLPLLEKFGDGSGAGVRCLILAPTRELAAQISREFALFSRHTRLRAAVIVGGESMIRQTQELRRGVEVLIACPGRLIDHLERGNVRLDRIGLVVIDEADRLLDMGFLPQLRKILRAAKKPRQTLMFSATMDPGVEQVAREFLDRPERVSVGPVATPPAAIRQAVYPVTLENKGPMLIEILNRGDVSSAIVFTRTKSRTDRITRMLIRNRLNAVAIHGGRSQSQRNVALAGFRKGTYTVLVATDVAARGLDIQDVSHVINFDLPEVSDTYIHRIGRTARMGKSGQALSLVTTEDAASLRVIERTLGAQIERATIDGFVAPDLTERTQHAFGRSSGSHRRSRSGRGVVHFSPRKKRASLAGR